MKPTTKKLKSILIGKYHLLDTIAIGSMAEVFRAKTVEKSRHEYTVAIKKITQAAANNDDFIRAMTVEARIASLINHPNVVDVYEFMKVEDEYFIVMEHVDGKDLQSILDKLRSTKSTLDIIDAVYIVKSMLLGLDAAHSQTDNQGKPIFLIHRDINPSNILLSYGGDIKICDFGIAKSTFSFLKTRAGIIKGKASYMSPEQAGGAELDHRTDLFSAGLVLYELLCGKPAWEGKGEIDLMKKAKSCSMKSISKVKPDISPRLAAIIDKALQKDKDQRYSSAANFAKALGIYLKKNAMGYSKKQFAASMKSLFSKEMEIEQKKLNSYELTTQKTTQNWVDLISDDEWEESHIGYSDFLNYDDQFPTGVASGTETDHHGEFGKSDTAISNLSKSKSDITDVSKNISHLKGNKNDGNTDKKAIDPKMLKSHTRKKTNSPKKDIEKNSINNTPTEEINLQLTPLDRKTNGTRPLFSLKEEAKIEEELKKLNKNKVDLKKSENNPKDKPLDKKAKKEPSSVKKTEDSGDFIVSLKKIPIPQKPIPQKTEAITSGSIEIGNSKPESAKNENSYDGEFTINLEELKKELETDSDSKSKSKSKSESDTKTKKKEDTFPEIVLSADDVVVEPDSIKPQTGVIDLGTTENELDEDGSFIINLSSERTLTPSRNSISTTMSGEFVVPDLKKEEKRVSTNTVEIDISMLEEYEPESE
jgi:eukaryotic-like serine/threonine-protein kinase